MAGSGSFLSVAADRGKILTRLPSPRAQQVFKKAVFLQAG
jgi:hypothetical protein